MVKINWDQFKARNENAKKAFEDMCHQIFCKRYERPEGINKSGNHPGIEADPIEYQGKWYGYQAKFLGDKTNPKVELTKSITTACKWKKEGKYPNLDVIVIYIYPAPGANNKYQNEIETIAKESSIEIDWVFPSRIESLLMQDDFSSIAEVYFSFQFDDFKKAFEALKTEETIKETLSSEIASGMQPSSGVIPEVLDLEYHQELNYAKNLIEEDNPQKALKYLNELKNRIFDSASQKIKFRILSNIGAAKLNIHQDKDAANLFIEAFQYSPEEEKAIENRALAHLLLGEFSEAQKYCSELIKKNPKNIRAYSVLIQSSINESFESILEKVPKSLLNEKEISYALGFIARRKNNYEKSEEFLEKAIHNFGDNNVEILGFYAGVILEQEIKNPAILSAFDVSPERKKRIEKAINLLNKAWEIVKDTDSARFRVELLTNRSTAKNMLGQRTEAMKDIGRAFELDPENIFVIKQLALNSMANGKFDETVAILKNVKFPENEETGALFLDALYMKGDFEELSSSAQVLLKQNHPPELKDEIRRILIKSYIQNKKLNDAEKETQEFLIPNNIANAASISSVKKELGQGVEALKVLKDIPENVLENAHPKEILEVAEQFYALKSYLEAAHAYIKIADFSVENQVLQRLIYSYYRAEDDKSALDAIARLRGHIENVSRFVVEIETDIYGKMNNLQKQREIFLNYLRFHPEDFEIKLHIAILQYRLEDYERVDQFLEIVQKQQIETLSFEMGAHLSYLYSMRGHHLKAIEIMYGLRSRFFNKPEAHLKYIGCFLGRDDETKVLLNTPKVALDTAVRVQSDDQTKWYVIENEGLMNSPEVITSEHLLAKELLGASVGEKICIQKDVSEKFLTVLEIQHKYIRAFQDSMTHFQEWFPGVPGLWSVQIKDTEKEGEMPEGFQTILRMSEEKAKHGEEIEELYKAHKITIGAFSGLGNSNIIDAWHYLINKPELGVFCCIGTLDERTNALGMLKKQQIKLIVDAISVLTIKELKIEDLIIENFGKLGASQSLIDEFKELIQHEKVHLSKGHASIYQQNGQKFYSEISPEAIQKRIDYLEEVLKWIQANCEILACNKATEITRERLEKLKDLLGDSSFEAILIASEEGNLLFSDDFLLRSLAKHEYGVDGVWTQLLLIHLLENKMLTKETYLDKTIELLQLNYRHITINAETLLYAARKAHWNVSDGFAKTLDVIEHSDEESAINVIMEFIYLIWIEPILTSQKDNLLFIVLEELTKGREIHQERILNKLIIQLRRKFIFLPLHSEQVITLISQWRLMH